MQDGTLLRGEVLARWQEFVGTGEFFRQVESTVSRLRDRITSFFRGEPPPSERLGEALQTGVAALIANNAELAAGASARGWRTLPGGAQLLTAHPTLVQASTDLDGRIERLVRDWQGDIFAMVREEGKDRRVTARLLAYGVNGLGLTLILVAFASTAGLAMLEVGIAGGTAVAGQKVLEAVFGDQAVRDLARKARERLFERVEDLYASELERYRGRGARDRRRCANRARRWRLPPMRSGLRDEPFTAGPQCPAEPERRSGIPARGPEIGARLGRAQPRSGCGEPRSSSHRQGGGAHVPVG